MKCPITSAYLELEIMINVQGIIKDFMKQPFAVLLGER